MKQKKTNNTNSFSLESDANIRAEWNRKPDWNECNNKIDGLVQNPFRLFSFKKKNIKDENDNQEISSDNRCIIL